MERSGGRGYEDVREKGSLVRSLQLPPISLRLTKAFSEFCKNELYMIEHEAEPLADNEFAKLKRKRKRRRACTCDLESGSVIAELEDR